MLEQEPGLEPSANGWWNEGPATPTMGNNSSQIENEKAAEPVEAQEYFTMPGNPYQQQEVIVPDLPPMAVPSACVASMPSNDKRNPIPRMVKKAQKGKRSEMESNESVSEGECRGKTDKKKLRLERNRKCAKESRRKKKEYIQGIEAEVHCNPVTSLYRTKFFVRKWSIIRPNC